MFKITELLYHDISIDFLKKFNLHDLTIQDIQHGKQRNKFESYDHYSILLLRNFDTRSNFKSELIII